jgi:dipeptidyl aminopeptidase/acylaminoacyl peptidase
VDVHDSKEGSIFVAPAPEGGTFSELRNYNREFEGTVTDVRWLDDNTMLFASEEGVHSTLRSIGLDDRESTMLVEAGTAAFTDFSAASGIVAFSGSTPEHPSELFTYEVRSDRVTRATSSNPWLNTIRLARQEEFRYEAADGLEITSVLLYPLDYEPGKRYPLITYIHGGPEACNLNGWNGSYGNWGQAAAARGYFVFMPNYRSSTGRGVEFLRMGFGDLAGAEFDDVIDGIDALADKGYIDRNRVGIGGGSYGGYFSAWGATRFSDRFAAAVVFVGVSDQISKRNTTDIPYEDYYVHWGFWTSEDWEKVYDRSPVKWAQNSHTPTLILHGTKDPRVHPSQSLELYRTLKLHGKAPVRLVWYPGEGHGNRLNPARLDYSLRTLEWFDYYLKNKGPANEMPPKDITYPLD